MFIGVSGTLCSGKSDILKYLLINDFKCVILKTNEELDDIFNVNREKFENDIILYLKQNISLGSEVQTPNNLEQIRSKYFKYFNTLNELMDFVTVNWKKNYVITNLESEKILNQLSIRPFFLHISIDAPIFFRYKRYINKYGISITENQFIQINDNVLIKNNGELVNVINNSTMKFFNSTFSLTDLFKKLTEINLFSTTRLRPQWDNYFMELANFSAMRSNCMKRKVGSIIVKNNRIIATGYNGTPKNLPNCNDSGCGRCNDGNEKQNEFMTCLCLHSEENAIIEAGKDRIGNDSILYCNTCPCLTCSIKIVQSGIREVIYSKSYHMDPLSKKVFLKAGVKIRHFELPQKNFFF